VKNEIPILNLVFKLMDKKDFLTGRNVPFGLGTFIDWVQM
jgi:hypothetical protein